MSTSRLHLGYAIASFVCFLVATNGSDALAGTMLAHVPISTAIRDSVHTSLSQPSGSLILAAPFFIIGIVAAKLAKAAGSLQAKAFFTLSIAGLCALYLSGYWAAQHALLAEKWTAAALSVGLLPFQSILILVLAAFVAGFMFWRAERDKA